MYEDSQLKINAPNCSYNKQIFLKYNYICCNIHNKDEPLIFKKIEKSIDFMTFKNKYNKNKFEFNFNRSDYIYCKEFNLLKKIVEIMNNKNSKYKLKIQKIPMNYNILKIVNN